MFFTYENSLMALKFKRADLTNSAFSLDDTFLNGCENRILMIFFTIGQTLKLANRIKRKRQVTKRHSFILHAEHDQPNPVFLVNRAQNS